LQLVQQVQVWLLVHKVQAWQQEQQVQAWVQPLEAHHRVVLMVIPQTEIPVRPVDGQKMDLTPNLNRICNSLKFDTLWMDDCLMCAQYQRGNYLNHALTHQQLLEVEDLMELLVTSPTTHGL